jgi:hypothetical protein
VTYDPTNLPTCYKADGLRVDVTVQVRKDFAGIHMVGPHCRRPVDLLAGSDLLSLNDLIARSFDSDAM